MSYRQIYYHIVFATKYREHTINDQHCEALYQYIWGVIKNKNCTLYRINGVEDHLHLLTDLHPTIALADFIKDIKVSSSRWMKQSSLFPKFIGWNDRYAATVSEEKKMTILNYIKKQKEHHKRETLHNECLKLYQKHAVAFDEKHVI